MISFATEFPVPDTVTTTSFLESVKEWLLGSPHTNFKAEDVSELGAQLEGASKKANEQIEVLSIPESIGTGSCAVRYTKMDKGLEWVTTIAFSKGNPSGWVGIRIGCESQHPSVRLPAARKPVFVKTLLNKLGGGSDGELKVSTKPRYLTNSEVAVAARCITGLTGARLPIVYLSSMFRGGFVVNEESLSDRLSGMAHVVTEPNRPFSLRLMQDVAGENVYGGAVGIYWPDGGGTRKFFIGRQFDSSAELEEIIFEEIRQALVNRRPHSSSTWAYVQELVSREKFRSLQGQGSAEINDYIQNFDLELGATKQQLKEAENEISRLKAELRKYQSKAPMQSGIPLKPIAEQDLYEGEIIGIIMDAIEDCKNRVHQDSRRQHILDALSKSNPSTGQVELLREQLKSILRDYKSMDSKIKAGLEEIGFEISENGKHYKLVFQGDERYTFSLAKTASDHRGGLNLASDIANKIL